MYLQLCNCDESPEHKSHCCSIGTPEYDVTSLPMPPEPPLSRPPDGQKTCNFISIRPDIEGMSEKYWGEILERTVSSGSLHALQRSFHSPMQLHQFHPKRPIQLTTSFSKNSNLNLTEEDNAANYSNSEPKLYEPHIYHDASCAKSQRQSDSFDEEQMQMESQQQQHLQRQQAITAPDI